MSADASRIVFTAGRPSQVWLHERGAGATQLLSARSDGAPGNARSDQPAISADGQVVAFRTRATDLVAGTAGKGSDVVAKDLVTGGVEVVSGRAASASTSRNAGGPSVSSDGQHVAFLRTARRADAVPQAWVRDRTTGRVRRVSVPLDGMAGQVYAVSISGDGSRVAFNRHTAQTKNWSITGIAVHDLATGEIVPAGVELPGTHGALGTPHLSADGRHVLFTDFAKHVYVRDLELGQTRVVPVPSTGGELSWSPVVLSADAGHVAFVGTASPDMSPSVARLWTADLGPVPTTSTEALSRDSDPWVHRTRRAVAARGYELRVRPGRWEPVLGKRVTYQWLRNGKVIRGATRRTYVLTRADMGASVRVRESLAVPGLPVSRVQSAAFAAKRSTTQVRVRAPRHLRAGTPFRVRVSVRHHAGNRPQGRLRLTVGRHVRTVRVDRDGRVSVRVPGLRAGSRLLKVRHSGTRFVLGGTVRKSLVVRR